MKEGSRNEPIMLQLLPRFFETHDSEISNNPRIDIVRTAGLLVTQSSLFWLLALMQRADLTSGDQSVPCALEVKIMTSSKTLKTFDNVMVLCSELP